MIPRNISPPSYAEATQSSSDFTFNEYANRNDLQRNAVLPPLQGAFQEIPNQARTIHTSPIEVQSQQVMSTLLPVVLQEKKMVSREYLYQIILAVVATLLCCFPLGLYSLLIARRVMSTLLPVVLQEKKMVSREYLYQIILAVVATLLCCFPLGLYSLLIARRALILAECGREEEAKRNARSSLMFTFYSAILGCVIYGVSIGIYVGKVTELLPVWERAANSASLFVKLYLSIFSWTLWVRFGFWFGQFLKFIVFTPSIR